MNLSGAQDDDPGRPGDREPRSRNKTAEKEEIWTVFALALVFVKLWGFVDKRAPSRRRVRPRRCPPRRASDLGLFVLLFAVLVAICKGEFYEPPGYSNEEEMTKYLKKLAKEDKQIRDSNVELRNQITEMAEQLADLRAADEVKKAK